MGNRIEAIRQWCASWKFMFEKGGGLVFVLTLIFILIVIYGGKGETIPAREAMPFGVALLLAGLLALFAAILWQAAVPHLKFLTGLALAGLGLWLLVAIGQIAWQKYEDTRQAHERRCTELRAIRLVDLTAGEALELKGCEAAQ
jgi:hypothetical protein